MVDVESSRSQSLPPTGRVISPLSGVTWSAVIAGAVAAAVLSVILMILGSAFGLTAVSPWSGEGASAGTIAISVVIWLIVVQWLSSALGGYLAGRLRTKWVGVDRDEVFFRDTAHGFLAWAVATLLTVFLAVSAVSAVVSGGAKAVATVVSGGAQATMSSDSSGSSANPQEYFIDLLFRSDRSVVAAETRNYDPDADRGESLRILANGIVDGAIPESDKNYLAQMVASQTGMTQAEARARVDEVLQKADAAEQKIRAAADEARKAAMKFALFTFLSLIIGAFIASVAAAFGGSLRDDNERLHPTS